MNDHIAQSAIHTPKIVAIGGGKGGVGKSLVSILLSIELANQGKKTIIIDADLGGANLHTLMGVKTPARTLNDFVTRKYMSMEEICVPTRVKNLQMICGSSEILSFANPQYAQKNKIVQGLVRLPADHVILDLGAGTSYNVLDFFLTADYPIVVVTPQPISIQNAYGFVRNAVYRKLSRMAAQQSFLQKLISKAMDPKNDTQMHTIPDLFTAVAESYNDGVVMQLKSAIDSIRPWIITNNAQNERDYNAGRIIQLVSEKYLTVNAQTLGAIHYDSNIEDLVSRMVSIADLPINSKARTDAVGLIRKMLYGA